MTAQRIVTRNPPKVWTVTVRCKPWSLNDERSWHYHRRSKAVAQVRRDTAWEARALGIPNLGRIQVTARAVFDTAHRRDGSNYLPTVKAAVDGLVDAGVLADDDDRHIVATTLLAAGVDKVRGPYVTLRLRQVDPQLFGQLVNP